MQDFEKMGAFYLGRGYDLAHKQRSADLMLYDSKDLTTHGLCVGMTGSGKTGLCMALLEEAAIDGIPVIALDPKGDLGNLMLRFPDLAAADFKPWIDPNEAVRKGQSVEAYAQKIAGRWKSGLAEWDQTGARIQKLMDSADVSIYTPGSTAGRPLTVLRSFKVPPAQVIADGDLFREHVQSATAGVLALLGVQGDPMTSREHILLATILTHAWQAGQDLQLADLILKVQNPPFNKVGVFDLDTFYPPADRMQLALRLNALLASPGFQNWMHGAPLNIQNLLYGPGGKPRCSILSIAHLSDSERMFFVTILLNELIAWMRTQPGTSSLRAIFYMDEIFGYFPPTQNPPSKQPMLTLLKQARAFGLGILLATQNPVDLDYKGLSNTGTWFIGRLQTERDKLRVLDGLEGASTSAGSTFNRGQMDKIMAGLGSRVFLMHNVHEDAPRIFETRWVLSYLRGPLSREQIRDLTQPGQETPTVPAGAPSVSPATQMALPAKTTPPSRKPLVAGGVAEVFFPTIETAPEGQAGVYRPALFADVKAHYVKAASGVDMWSTYHLLFDLPEDGQIAWSEPVLAQEGWPFFDDEAQADFQFAPLSAEAADAKSFKTWSKQIKTHVYQERALYLWRYKKLKMVSGVDETEEAFRGQLAHALREKRDLEIEKLHKRYARRLSSCQDRIRRAQLKIDKESEQYKAAKVNTAVSIGATVIGALFGRKLGSYRNVSGAGTSLRRAQRAGIEKADIARAQQELEVQQMKLQELETEFNDAVADIELDFDPQTVELDSVKIAPRKSDIMVSRVGLAWTPWGIPKNGPAQALYDVEIFAAKPGLV